MARSKHQLISDQCDLLKALLAETMRLNASVQAVAKATGELAAMTANAQGVSVAYAEGDLPRYVSIKVGEKGAILALVLPVPQIVKGLVMP